MRRHVTMGLVASLLAACQAAPPASPGGPRATAAPAARPTGGPTGGPTASATGQPTPAAVAAPAALQPLAGAAVPLAGQVLVDAAYALGSGAGNRLVGTDGASLVGLDGASLRDGVVTANGRVVAAGAGNLVVPAALVGTDGASLIGTDGATLVGTDGASIVAAGAGNYALAQAGAAAGAPDVPAGAAWPAAGMWVSVVDTRTGFTLPLGQAGGAPAYTVYTDAAGRFKVQVPQAAAGFVRVVARPPGGKDPRLALNVLTGVAAAGAAEARLDDDTAAATAFLREILAARLMGAFAIDEATAQAYFTKGAAGDGGDVVAALAGPQIKAVHDALVEAGALAMPEPAKLELARLMADRVLGMSDLDVKIAALNPRPQDPAALTSGLVGQVARKTMGEVLARLRQAAEARARTEAAGFAAFDERPYVKEANMRRPADAPWRIRRGADLVDFVVREHLSSNSDAVYDRSRLVFDDLGLGLIERDRLRMAGASLVAEFLPRLFVDAGAGEPGSVAIAKLARETGAVLARAAGAGGPAPVPAGGTPPAVPAMDVTTVAGAWGEAGLTDGVGAAARFESLAGVAADMRPAAAGAPLTLYATEDKAGRLRRIRVDAAGTATVDTVRDDAGAPLVIGPSRGLAVDAQGRVVVACTGSKIVMRVTVAADGTGAVEVLAGGHLQAGFADGPGAAARFESPMDVAFDPAGDVWVADAGNQRIRKIALGQPGSPVSTVVGTGLGRGRDGALADALTEDAFALAAAPGGALWLLQYGSPAVRRVEDGRLRSVAGGDGHEGPHDGYWLGAWFGGISGAGAYGDDLLVTEAHGHRVRLVKPDGWAVTLAGGDGEDKERGAHADGPGATARFDEPVDACRGPDGAVWVVEKRGRLLRKLTPRR